VYRGQAVDVRKLARELGVRYIVEGSVRKALGRIRIACQLVEAASGVEVWAEKFDAALTDVFAVQDMITARVLSNLVPQIAAAEIERTKRNPPSTPEAWDLYLRALPLMRIETPEATSEAMGFLRRALELTPNFSAALARLSQCHTRAAYHGWDRSGGTAVKTALELARKALVIDAAEPLVHDALASAHQFQGEMNEAVAEAEAALALNPVLMSAFGTLISALAFLGRSEEAIAAYRLSEHCSPIDPDRSGRLFGFAMARFIEGNYPEVVRLARQHVNLRPNWYGSQTLLASAFALMGQQAEATAAVNRLLELVPKFTLARGRRRPMLARQEDSDRFFEGLARAGVPEA
jgi:adenylate cyclase